VKRHTLRGQFTEGETKRLILDDGRITHAMKVVSFIIAPDVTGAGNDAMATLSLESSGGLTWDWGDNRQIAWASTNAISVSGIEAPYSVIDPDHLVIQDLFIQGQVGGGGGNSLINYLIELEAVEITSDQSILQMIKERSQNASR
jgi:hypothetical protein